jgi:methanogenic corrinoid protein MtbC1
MAQLQPYFQRTPRNGRRLLAACVAGDLHTLGLQMVADFLEYEGWEVSYLGASTPLDSIRSMAAAQGIDLLLTAASMPHHVPLLRELVAALRRDLATQHVRVLVGGRPFAQDGALWESTGADGWANNAEEAVQVVKRLFQEETRSSAPQTVAAGKSH